MRIPLTRCSGKADPFGLLVLGVMLAVLVTIGIQVQASTPAPEFLPASGIACDAGCMVSATRD